MNNSVIEQGLAPHLPLPSQCRLVGLSREDTIKVRADYRVWGGKGQLYFILILIHLPPSIRLSSHSRINLPQRQRLKVCQGFGLSVRRTDCATGGHPFYSSFSGINVSPLWPKQANQFVSAKTNLLIFFFSVCVGKEKKFLVVFVFFKSS